MKKLIVIDISNFIFRAFFAIRPLHAPDGTPVNAVYGVLSMLHNMIVKYQPTHVLVARDTKEGSFRKEIYPEYKAHRTEPPDELVPQFALVDELVTVLGLPEIKEPRYEADDVIGSVVTQWRAHFDEILIVSGDKDLMQFVGGPVKMLDTMKEKIYEREDVKDKMGIYPEQIMDFLSLIGDSSDNIPGVDGIGPKGAQNLIEEFGTLENILANAAAIKNKRAQTAIAAHADMARLSKELVKIVCDLKLRFGPDEAGYQLRYDAGVEAFLNRVGFRSWQAKLAEFKAPGETAPVPELEAAKTVERWTLSEVKRAITGERAVAVTHVCDDDLDQHQCWRGMAVATEKAVGYVDLGPEEAKTFIDILHEASALVICYQSKPLLQLALVAGVTPDFKYFDLAQAHFILNPEHRHDLATITEEFLGFTLETAPKGQADLFGNDGAAELTLQGAKAQAILTLYPILRAKMQEMTAERAYDDLDLPLIKVLAAMELEGVSLDTAFYKELEREFSAQIETIEAAVYAAAGDKVNLRSPKQIGELLFEKLQLPVIRKTKTGYSTDAEVLTELAALKLNPIPELLL
jgi:DNA polymerase-1